MAYVSLHPSVLWCCWLGGRNRIRPVKNWVEWGADLHTAQLMPLPLTVSCFSKVLLAFTFLVPDHLVGPGQRAIKQVCVCVCVHMSANVIYAECDPCVCVPGLYLTDYYQGIQWCVVAPGDWESTCSFHTPRELLSSHVFSGWKVGEVKSVDIDHCLVIYKPGI